MRLIKLLFQMILRVFTTLCLCMQVILAFGSLWSFFLSLSGDLPGGLLKYPIGALSLVGAIAILYPELSAFGALILFPTWCTVLAFKILLGTNPSLEISMASLAGIIAIVNFPKVHAIIRTKSLGEASPFRTAWWRLALRYGMPSVLLLMIVGPLFYLFQKAEWGAHDIQGGHAIDKGNYSQAIVEYQRAIEMAEKFPRSTWRTIQGIDHLGVAYLRSQQVELAEKTFREAVHLCQSELGPNDDHYYLYYRSIEGLAATFTRQMRFQEAEALYLQAIASNAIWSPPAMPFGYLAFDKGVRVIAHLLNDQQSIVEADKQLRMAVDSQLNTQLSGLPEAMDGLAGFYLDQSQFAKAETYFKRALLLKAQILAHDAPTLGQQILDIPIHLDVKAIDESDLYAQFRTYLDNMSAENRETIGASLNSIALTYWEQGRSAEAEPLYLLSLAINRSAAGENSPSYARTLTNLGLLYNTDGRFDEAEPRLAKALSIREHILTPDHPDLGHSYNNLALLYDNRHQAAKAAPLYERALSIRQKALGPSHRKSVLTLDLLTSLYLREVLYSKAEPLLIQLIQIKQQQHGIAHSEVINLKWKLAGAYSEQGKYRDAISIYENIIPIIEEQFGPTRPMTLQALSSYAYVMSKDGRQKEAREVRKRIQETESAITPPPMLPSHPPKHRTKKQERTI